MRSQYNQRRIYNNNSVNSSCVMYGHYFYAILLAHALTYACTHARSCVCANHNIIMLNKCKNHSNRDAGMGCTMRKIVDSRKPLINTIKDTSTIMRNPSLHTVKPPNKGRIGDSPAVPSREVVLFQRFSLKTN